MNRFALAHTRTPAGHAKDTGHALTAEVQVHLASIKYEADATHLYYEVKRAKSVDELIAEFARMTADHVLDLQLGVDAAEGQDGK